MIHKNLHWAVLSHKGKNSKEAYWQIDMENNYYVKWLPQRLTKLLKLDVCSAVCLYSLSYSALFKRTTKNVSREL